MSVFSAFRRSRPHTPAPASELTEEHAEYCRAMPKPVEAPPISGLAPRTRRHRVTDVAIVAIVLAAAWLLLVSIGYGAITATALLALAGLLAAVTEGVRWYRRP